MDFFATRIHRVRFHNGVVRIEFCTLEPDESGSISPQTPVKPEHIKFSVAIPVASLPRSIMELRNMHQELIEKGVLRKPDESQRRRHPGGEGGDDSPLV